MAETKYPQAVMPRFIAACESDKTIEDRVLAWYTIDNEARKAGASYHEYVIHTFNVKPLNGSPEAHPDIQWYPEGQAKALAGRGAKRLNRLDRRRRLM